MNIDDLIRKLINSSYSEWLILRKAIYIELSDYLHNKKITLAKKSYEQFEFEEKPEEFIFDKTFYPCLLIDKEKIYITFPVKEGYRGINIKDCDINSI